jgi:hypothetical protein
MCAACACVYMHMYLYVRMHALCPHTHMHVVHKHTSLVRRYAALGVLRCSALAAVGRSPRHTG